VRTRIESWIGHTLVPLVGYLYIRFLRRTMRIEYRNAEVLERARASSGAYILAFWHSRFVMMPYVYPEARIVVLVSRHRDAQRLARILHRFGLETVDGSSTRGGVAGMRAILRKIRDGYDVGITPDGPKGPRRIAKPGVVTVAKLSGLPVVPVAFSASPGWRLRSWDRTLLPRPFGRGVFLYGEPIPVPRDLDGAGEERVRAEIEQAIDRLTDEADTRVGAGLDPPKDTPS
jgi:lysophospholipid acyltransferase (LPLAT)-like uncharacterized protein